MLLAEVRFDCHVVLRGRAATVSEVEVVRCITSRSDQTGKYFSYNFEFSSLFFSTDRSTDRPTDRSIDRPTGRQTDRPTD